jgi:O-antigen/teichoic acid export membrane protein
MRRDVASAYLAVAARVGGLLLVSAVVYRRLGFEAFAVFNLIRSTVGLLNYTGLGLAPAMVRMLAQARQEAFVLPAHAVQSGPSSEGPPVLTYATPSGAPASPAVRVYAAGELLAFLLGLLGLVAVLVHGFSAPRLYGLTNRYGLADPAAQLALGLGTAILLRLISEPPGSALLVSGRIALDNTFVAMTEFVGAGLAVASIGFWKALDPVGWMYALATCLLLLLRLTAAHRAAPDIFDRYLEQRWRIRNLDSTAMALLGFGVMVTLGQLADFLYSPVDFILINKLLRLEHVGIYAPAVQIDAGLLTLVTGLSTVLLPKAAVAHSAGETARVRRYYLLGTLASTALLLAAALAVWLLSPWILRFWLGRDMPETRAILPLVLIHTVVGGSSAVGRSILLGMGKVKPFTASVLVAGVSNVALSYVFVRFFGWGLRGIVLGTIIAVVARAGVWTPWYVLRTLKRNEATPAASGPSSPTSG